MNGIPNTPLLTSHYYTCHGNANFEVFDLTNRTKVKKIYRFEEKYGNLSSIFKKAYLIVHVLFLSVRGYGDVTYNVKRSFRGVVSKSLEAVYDIFYIDNYSSNTNDIVKLIRRSKRHPEELCN